MSNAMMIYLVCAVYAIGVMLFYEINAKFNDDIDWSDYFDIVLIVFMSFVWPIAVLEIGACKIIEWIDSKSGI